MYFVSSRSLSDLLLLEDPDPDEKSESVLLGSFVIAIEKKFVEWKDSLTKYNHLLTTERLKLKKE